MWFWLSLIALLCWSGSDLFSKIGCRDARDKYSHLKMVMAVGVVMGLHAAYEVFVGGTVINLDIILTYLPVSILYILSMAMGYVGLRYIELSISSPICNSSGALVAVLAILFDGIAGYSPLALFAVALVCVGAVGLGVVEAREDDELRIERQKASNYKYTKSFMALAMPAAYCVLDAAGTFADSRVLEIISRTVEDYETTSSTVKTDFMRKWHHNRSGKPISLDEMMESEDGDIFDVADPRGEFENSVISEMQIASFSESTITEKDREIRFVS